MKLFVMLVLLNLILAMAVAGFVRVQWTAKAITITLETRAISRLFCALKNALAEFMSTFLRRRRRDSDEVTSSRPYLTTRRD